MKTSSILFLIAVFFMIGCATRKNEQPKVNKAYDVQQRMIHKQVIFPVWYVNGGTKYDTSTYDYYYNDNNTLDYAVHCPRSGGFECSEEFGGYISKYFYWFDTLLQQAGIIGWFYEKCSDYPLKYRKIYNTKGNLVEEWYWEVTGGHSDIDTPCFNDKVMVGYDVFDTAWGTAQQHIIYKRIFQYDIKDRLDSVFVFEPPPHFSPEDAEWYNSFCMYNKNNCAAPMYIGDCEKEERELTIIPYLKSLGKLK